MLQKCATFGCKSSPGIFCRCARLPVRIVLHELGLPQKVASMHLDDLVMGGRRVSELTRAYRDLMYPLRLKAMSTSLSYA